MAYFKSLEGCCVDEGADLLSSIPQVDPTAGSYRKIDFPSTEVQLSNRAIHTKLE